MTAKNWQFECPTGHLYFEVSIRHQTRDPSAILKEEFNIDGDCPICGRELMIDAN